MNLTQYKLVAEKTSTKAVLCNSIAHSYTFYFAPVIRSTAFYYSTVTHEFIFKILNYLTVEFNIIYDSLHKVTQL